MKHLTLVSKWKVAPVRGPTGLLALKSCLVSRREVCEDNGDSNEVASISELIADVDAEIKRKKALFC